MLRCERGEMGVGACKRRTSIEDFDHCLCALKGLHDLFTGFVHVPWVPGKRHSLGCSFSLKGDSIAAIAGAMSVVCRRGIRYALRMTKFNQQWISQ